MSFFTEQMEMLTNELLTSRQERADFVSNAQQQTHKFLADAQTFVQVLGQEHESMAAQLRNELATGRHERSGQVKAQRQQNREHLQSLRKGLKDMLSQTRRQRQQHLAETRTEFRAAQQELASDLRQAAQTWHQMFQTRAAATKGSQPPKTKKAKSKEAGHAP